MWWYTLLKEFLALKILYYLCKGTFSLNVFQSYFQTDTLNIGQIFATSHDTSQNEFSFF